MWETALFPNVSFVQLFQSHMVTGQSQGRVFWLPFSIFIHFLLLISNPQGGQSRRKSTLARLTRPIVSVLSISSAPRWLRFKKAGKGLNFHKYSWIESETQRNVKVHLWPSFDFQLLCLKVRDRLLNAHNSLDSVGRLTNNVFAFWESKYWLHIHFWIPRFSKLTTSSSLGSSPKKPMWHTGVHTSLFRCLGGTYFSKIEPEAIMCGELCFYHWWNLFSMAVVKIMMVAHLVEYNSTLHLISSCH